MTPENLEAYRELALAGLMIPLHTFAHGRESAYRMTEAGVQRSFFDFELTRARVPRKDLMHLCRQMAAFGRPRVPVDPTS